jgi:hypothetical protein
LQILSLLGSGLGLIRGPDSGLIWAKNPSSFFGAAIGNR